MDGAIIARDAQPVIGVSSQDRPGFEPDTQVRGPYSTHAEAKLLSPYPTPSKVTDPDRGGPMKGMHP